MAYESKVYRILIASPSDVDEEREIASRIIQDWNDLNSFNKKIVLLPVRWETHSSPTYGVRPQEAINRQVVDDCDLLIGFFWTKLGTPTGTDLSGTLEEIKRVSAAGKPIMLYFSKRGKDPSLIDLKQLSALNDFKEEVYKIALVENYNSVVDFRDKLSRHLEMKIRELQEDEGKNLNLITFSFVNPSTGEFIGADLKKEVEIVSFDENKINELLKSEIKLKDKKWEFKREIISFLKQKNNLPIIFGLKNNSHRILTNAVADLKIKSSIDNQLSIDTIEAYDDYSFYNELVEYNLSKESVSTIRRLFNKNINQMSSKTWEYNSKPSTLIPDKLEIIGNVFFLFPKASMKLNFDLSLFSDNLLQSIQLSGSLDLKVKIREVTNEEINEIIENSQYDDVPF